MELEHLKKTWNKITTEKELDEGQLRSILGSRTKSLIERIDRNIKIGFFILLALVAFFVIDAVAVNPEKLMEEGLTFPKWLVPFGILSNILLFGTFIYFATRYYRVKKTLNKAHSLHITLTKIIETLLLYKRLFYSAIVVFLFAIGSAFTFGILKGFSQAMENDGLNFADLGTFKLILSIGIVLLFLLLFVGGVFLLLRWGFRSLYGNYIDKLKLTLKELEEID